MDTLPLPTTDRTISRIGLGAMPLSLAGRPERSTAIAVVRRAVELGVTLIDTADVYALDDADLGHNERLIREALDGMGGAPQVTVATKGGMRRPQGRWTRDGRPERLRTACEASLRALGTDRIALYQFHTPDPSVPFAERVGALARLREEGKVEAVGLSNVTLAQIREAQRIVPIASVQNRLGPWDVSGAGSPLFDHCHESGVLFLPYAPLGGRRRVALLSEAPALVRLAARTGATPPELVLAWLLRFQPNMVPIPGAGRVTSIESSVRAASLRLDDTTADAVRRALRRLPGTPGPARRIASGLLRRAKRILGGTGR